MENAGTTPIFEASFTSGSSYLDPVGDVKLRTVFVAPSGKQREVEAFWDGEDEWRVRFWPDEAGLWRYQTICSSDDDQGLHGQEGEFSIEPYQGESAIYRRGSVTLADDRLSLVHSDGTPFFWLADTAWNGVLKASLEDWREYLTARHQQGFTAVQCVMTQWRALERDDLGETAFTGTENIRLNPPFFTRLDAKVAAVTDHGLVPVLVLLWALTPKDPGHYLPEKDCIKLARYMVARYGAYQPIWFLGGDGRYLGDGAERWKRIGRAVFDTPERQLVTLHPAGMEWTIDDFGDESWFDFVGYQSGHGDDEPTLRWLVEGPPAQAWGKGLRKPIINLEPCYEAHLAYQSREPFDAYKVRRALYWSLLVSPTAGVTYGHHGVWPWMEVPGVPADHEKSGEAPTWREALTSEGVDSLRHLRQFFDGMEWWKLRPAQEWLERQPGETDAQRFVAVAAAHDQSFAVAYAPRGDKVALQADRVSHLKTAHWFDPATGRWRDASGDRQENHFTPPGEQDWLLLLQP